MSNAPVPPQFAAARQRLNVQTQNLMEKHDRRFANAMAAMQSIWAVFDQLHEAGVIVRPGMESLPIMKGAVPRLTSEQQRAWPQYEAALAPGVYIRIRPVIEADPWKYRIVTFTEHDEEINSEQYSRDDAVDWIYQTVAFYEITDNVSQVDSPTRRPRTMDLS